VSLLENLPHRCTIRRRVRSKGTLGGSKDSFTVEQTGVHCWEQKAGDSEITEFSKRGIRISRKVYFVNDPEVTERHQILITEKSGVVDSDPTPLDVKSTPRPDADVGFGLLFRVFVDESTGEEN